MQLAPAAATTQGSTHLRGTIGGDDAFRLYDTFGFPIDLTELMARERGYAVDIAGFEAALGAQRTQSQEERKSRKLGVVADELSDLERWERAATNGASESLSTPFVGYDAVEIETQVAAVRRLDGDRVAMLLRETPFYAESGGQVSDHGEIVGDGWRVEVDDVKKVDGRIAAIGTLSGTLTFGPAVARVPGDRRRDTERNHTATHLLHAALRAALGDHVHQAGSLVAPDRLRFDFTHHGPIKPEILEEIERTVNRGIWASVDVRTEERPYKEARGGRRDGAVRREVRRRGARGEDPGALGRALRRNARAQHRADLAVQDPERDGSGGRRSAHRGGYRAARVRGDARP